MLVIIELHNTFILAQKEGLVNLSRVEFAHILCSCKVGQLARGTPQPYAMDMDRLHQGKENKGRD